MRSHTGSKKSDEQGRAYTQVDKQHSSCLLACAVFVPVDDGGANADVGDAAYQASHQDEEAEPWVRAQGRDETLGSRQPCESSHNTILLQHVTLQRVTVAKRNGENKST